MTKHYYDSEGKAESGSATTDKYIPKDIAEGTFYDGTSYNIKNFPSGKDSEYTWYTDEKMTGTAFKYTDITQNGVSLNLYGKKKTVSPSTASTATPAPTKDPVSPKQQPVIGNVTCVGTVSPTTSYDKVTLTRTDTTVPGTLKLKPTDFGRSGSNQCDYVFTPTDTSKYAEVTGKVWVNVDRDTLTSITADGTLQKGTYKYGESFDISGLKVTAHFQSGKSKDVTNYIKVYTMSFLSYIPSYCTINNTTIFCSINSTDFYIILWLTVVGVSLQKFFIQKLLHKFTLANQTSPMARFL